MTADTRLESNDKRRYFSLKAFLLGMLFVCLFYSGLAGWLFLTAGATKTRMQDKLASQTVIIERLSSAYMPVYGPPRPDAQPPVLETGKTDAAAPVSEDPPATESLPTANEEKIDLTGQLPPGLDLLASGLAVAPIEGLYETAADGRLPVIRKKDGLTAFKAYRRPFNRAATDKPVVSIAIVDIGLSEQNSTAAVKNLPPEISLALSPYSTTPDLWVNEARNSGHEVWMMLPMEPENYPLTDPGPHTLLISAPERQNIQKLSWVMGRTIGYAGMIATKNPVFMNSLNDMRPVVGMVYSRGLAFVDTSSSPGTVPQTMALGQHAAYGTADLWIDNVSSREAIADSLKQLEDEARRTGAAVGLIHPLPLSMQEISKWIETLPQKNLVLAPLSAQTGM